MKAGIDDNGILYIESESSIEEYALKQWIGDNLKNLKDGVLIEEDQLVIMSKSFIKRLL